MNIRSLLSKKDELTSHIANAPNKIDFLCISETHLNNSILDSVISMNGYEIYRRERIQGKGGGVLAYVSLKLQVKRRFDLETVNTETVWLEMSQKYSKSILICTVYRPPNSSVQWLDHFEIELSNAMRTKLHVIILGDLNINYLVNIPLAWSNICNSYGLTQVVNEATRITFTSATLIDHIYVTDTNYVKDTCISSLALSDHFPVGITWRVYGCKSHIQSSSGYPKGNHHGYPKGNHRVFSYRRMNSDLLDNFRDQISASLQTIYSLNNVDNKVSVFTETLKQSFPHAKTVQRRVKLYHSQYGLQMKF